MKLLMLNYEYPPIGGGGGVIHQHIAEELARRHDVTVLTSGYGSLPSEEVVNHVKVHRVNVLGRKAQSTASLVSMLSFFPASLRKGQQLIDRIEPHLINTHFAVPTGPSGTLLAGRNRIPHVLHIHGGDIFDPSKRLSPHRTPLLRQTVRWVLRRSDRVLAGSSNTADNARSIYGYDREITIIPYGLKRPKLRGPNRAALGLSNSDVVVVTVCRLVARKANDQLVRAVAALRNPNVKLILIGDGPEREKLARLAVELGVAHQVTLAGYVTEERKFEYLEAADVFASTTAHEGFGLMYVEAMFCGLPIITYNHGGQSDFLRDGQTGFLVTLNDEMAFRSRLDDLARDPALRRRCGDQNRTLSDQFTVEHCALRVEQVFRQMVDRKADAVRGARASLEGAAV